MNADHKPLYALTIREFTNLTRQVIEEILSVKYPPMEIEKEDHSEEHLTIKELAAFLHCSKVSIHNYKKNGLPFYRLGRKILFKKQDVLNFMKGFKSRRGVV